MSQKLKQQIKDLQEQIDGLEAQALAKTRNLQAELQKIIDGDYGIKVSEYWGEEGSTSKLNKCEHGKYLYEDCINCVDKALINFKARL